MTFVLAQTTGPAAGAPAPAPTSDQLLSGSTATGTAATTGAPGTVVPAGGGQPPPAPPFNILWIVPLFLAALIIPQWLSSRKQSKKRKEMFASMGKGDKVITIGGQIGVIDQIRENEVVLRTDENSNAKSRFTRSAIQSVLESSGKGSSEAESSANGTIEIKTKGEKAAASR